MTPLKYSLIIVPALIATPSFADENSSGLYLGLKANYSQYENLKLERHFDENSWPLVNTQGVGLLVGYQFTDYLSAEVEYAEFDTETKNDEVNDCLNIALPCTTAPALVESRSYAAYIAYRGLGKYYLKGKIGYQYTENEVIFERSDVTLDTVYQVSLVSGVGAGLRLNNVSLEAEYTYSSRSVSYVSAGAFYHF
ncbi:outer membrane protein with beta-barrel domain [Sinobacterium caligoides]|uniref:Outer membrane protein with beta-barrel domain n=1 Tax=Sinobacterium caligoides TaxID=933926 RepID=A0A3N2D634_9GAMM|nr:outer membrane beta-barrel protein [Sinobacterium caligoides]ROR94944.1 outer membrane protein with beta-barrel domain [Sinobacterium caligoides]